MHQSFIKTGIVFDPIFFEHQPTPPHPESPERLEVIGEVLKTFPHQESLVHFQPRRASFEELCLVHTPGHVARLAATAGKPLQALDADTQAGGLSYEVALQAAGAPLVLVDAVMDGTVDNGFAFVRP